MCRLVNEMCSVISAALVCGLGHVVPAWADSGERRADELVVVLALDTSGSLRGRDLDQAKSLAMASLKALPPGTETAVFTFDDQARLLLPRTSDPDDVRRALRLVAVQGRYTALHDVVYEASRYLGAAPVARKAIVLITDGQDENSDLDLDDGLELAVQRQVPIFTVGVGKPQERVLRRVARLTGGQYIPIQQMEGSALASRILMAVAGQVRAEVTPMKKAAAEPKPAAAGAPVREAPPSPRSRRIRPAVWVTSAVGAVLLLALLALRRKRSRPRCPTCGRELPDALGLCTRCVPRAAAATLSLPKPPAAAREPAPEVDAGPLSETVVSRLNNTEEYLEKTVHLTEKLVLVVTAGGRSGQAFGLNQDTSTSVGRARANDVILDDVAVSSQHFRIRPDNGHFVLHDLQSTNGTFVNEKRVTRHVLAEGDVIKAGETSIQFRREVRRA